MTTRLPCWGASSRRQRQQHFVKASWSLPEIAPGVAAGRLHEGVSQGELAGGQVSSARALSVGNRKRTVFLADDFQALVPLVAAVRSARGGVQPGRFRRANPARRWRWPGFRSAAHPAEGFGGGDGNVLGSSSSSRRSISAYPSGSWAVSVWLATDRRASPSAIADQQPSATRADKQAGDSRRGAASQPRRSGHHPASRRPLGMSSSASRIEFKLPGSGCRFRPGRRRWRPSAAASESLRKRCGCRRPG